MFICFSLQNTTDCSVLTKLFNSSTALYPSKSFLFSSATEVITASEKYITHMRTIVPMKISKLYLFKTIEA